MSFDRWKDSLMHHAPGLCSALDSGVAVRIKEELGIVRRNDPELGADRAPSNAYVYCAALAVSKKAPDAFLAAWNSSMSPEITITYDEIDEVRKESGLKPFGSPQDALYTLVSDRAEKWSQFLNDIGLTCAIMSAPKTATFVCATSRFLESTPDIVINEMLGAITADTIDALDILSVRLKEDPAHYYVAAAKHVYPDFVSEVTGLKDDDLERWQVLRRGVASRMQEGSYVYRQAGMAEEELKQKRREGLQVVRAEILKPRKRSLPDQEQVALKFLDQGLFLQKLYDGVSFEAIGNNVKMVPNMLRNNKIEIDAVYRASGRQLIVAVEAKNNIRVSRTQIYSIYETLRLLSPVDWHVDVVVLLTHKSPNSEDTNIDLIRVGFDEKNFGKLTESINGVFSRRTIRWQIKAAT